jgi:LPXTG-motif cell wall-anchored protein
MAPLAEVVVPDEVDSQVAIRVPRSVALGAALREITFTADPETEPGVLLTLSEATAELIGFVEFQAFEHGEWVDVAFDEDGTYRFRVTGGEAKLRVGVSQESYERDWQLFLDSVSAFAENSEPEALDFIDFTTELLLDGPGDSQFQEHSIALVTPEIQLTEAAPEEVEAGDSFTFSYRITNRTGSDYPSSASLDLLEFGTLMVEDEGYAVDSADMALTCSVDGRAPVEVDLTEIDYPFLGPSGSVPLGGLPSGSSVDVDCQVDLAADLPDSELELLPLLTLGESRAPLTDLGDAAQTITILEWSEPAPTPTPTQPAPAQPAPVRPTPTPTPTNPPAAAPVRQVPATELPRTGTDPLPLAAAGLGLVLAGAGALLGGRRRAHN